MCKKNKNNNPTTMRRAILAMLVLIATFTVILIVMLTMAACTPEALIDQPTTDPDTHGGTLIIGNINVGTPTSPTAAGTRIGIDDNAFTTGDKIKVEAICYDTDNSILVSTIYTYTQATNGTDTYAWLPEGGKDIIVERIEASTTPIITSYGGIVGEPNPDSYTNQSTEPNYRLNDWMTSTNATLSGRTLNATMRHMNVDVVVNITDAAALPANATLKLNGMSGNTPIWITTWNSGTTSTTADGTTTFRACVNLTDVPGITAFGTVPDNSLLGTLTYTPAGSTEAKTLKVRYSIKKNADGTAATIKSGMRITINVPFSTTVTGIATVTPWNDTDGGEVGTTEGVVLSTGESKLDPAVFTADNPLWIITGGTDASTTEENTAEQDAVMENVRNALTALNNNPNARINLMLTGFAGKIDLVTYDNGTPITCKALEYISAPAATSVVTSAFYQCTALTTVSLPAAEIIRSTAFYQCTALTTISLPKADSIGNYAFYNCPKLNRLELTGTEPITVGVDAFNLIDGINNNNDGTKNVTLVLNESIKGNEEKQKQIGVTIAEDGKTVTFLDAITDGGGGTTTTDLTVTFRAIEYLSS